MSAVQPRESFGNFAAVIAASPLAVIVRDMDGRIETWNPAAERIFGWNEEELRGRPAPYYPADAEDEREHLRRSAIPGENVFNIETARVRKDGRRVDVILSASLVYDAAGQPVRCLTMIADNTERKQAERNLQFVATHDALTGLSNRTMFCERLQQALAQAHRHDRRVALLFIDLDGFKLINDRLGHDAGDCVLAELAHRLRECMREGDTLGRMGGDEFVVLIEDYREDTHVVEVARKILDTVARPLVLREGSYTVTASIGIATCPQDGRHAPELLKSADLAMYRAKNEGRNTFRFHSAEMNTHLVERVGMKRALRVALERQEITVFYQPRVSLQADRMLGIEALVRWMHPTQGLLTPTQFLPIAEESGTYGLIGAWIFASACRQLREWQRCGVGDLRVALNISACELAQDDFVERLRASISRSGIEPACLELEITEATLMRHAERAGRLLSRGERTRRAHRSRRFRHRLFVAGLPQTLPDRCRQDRSLARRAASEWCRRGRHRVRRHRHGRQPGSRSDRRRRRDTRAARVPCPSRVPCHAGQLLLRACAA